MSNPLREGKKKVNLKSLNLLRLHHATDVFGESSKYNLDDKNPFREVSMVKQILLIKILFPLTEMNSCLTVHTMNHVLCSNVTHRFASCSSLSSAPVDCV